MESRIKPIPAFYCCYLLRSTVRHASLYVGSSPNPLRRLNQHNGKAKGGAVRTSRLSVRPWEMACVVAGFPSNIAALQFEWAWQNAHLTRHIAQDERLSFPVTKVKINARTGKTRRKPTRPPSSLIEKLSNLHLLLRTRYFSQWPLELRFFSGDVYKAWQSWSQRVDKQVRPEIRIVLDLPQEAPQPIQSAADTNSPQPPKKKCKVDMVGKGGIEGIDATYARYQDLFEKSRFILDEGDEQTCAICNKEIDIKNDVYTLCAANGCTSLSHMTCLSSRFLQQADSTNLVPERGKCPTCQNETEWSDLMRAVSLRIRGEKEVAKLLKKKKRGSKIATAAGIMDEDESDEDDENDENDTEDEMLTSADVIDEQNEADEDDDVIDDNVSVASLDSFDSKSADIESPAKRAILDPKLEIVIEDSEDE